MGADGAVYLQCPGKLVLEKTIALPRPSEEYYKFDIDDKGIQSTSVTMAGGKKSCNRLYDCETFYEDLKTKSIQCLNSLRINFGAFAPWKKEGVVVPNKSIRKLTDSESFKDLIHVFDQKSVYGVYRMYTEAIIDVREPNFRGVLKTKSVPVALITKLFSLVIKSGKSNMSKSEFINLGESLKKENISLLKYFSAFK